MKKSICGLLVLLLLGQFSAYAQQSKSPPPKLSVNGEVSDFKSSDLETSFDSYGLYQIDFSALRAVSKAHDIFETQLKLGDEHVWNLVFLLHDMRADHYTQKVNNGKETLQLTRERATTYKGFVNNPGSLGEAMRFNISDELISGYVTVNGQEYFLEPLSMTDKKAPGDVYVIYRPEDVLEEEEHLCTVELMHKNNPFEEGEIEFDQKQSGNTDVCIEVEFVTACTFDFVNNQGGAALANARITAITNLMEGLYAPFNLTYLIVEQFAPANAAADPFTNSALAEDLLFSMRDFAGPNMATHDIGQLWTQRDIFGCGGAGTGLVGCAFTGVVCTQNRYSLIENFTNNNNCLRTLSAHEIGHNWNSPHGAAGFIMSTPLNCGGTTFSAPNTTIIQAHIDSRNCLDNSQCCELVINCDNVVDQTITCAEDIPAPDESLVVIDESCGTVDIFVVDEGTGTPGDPLVRYYFVVDEEGNTEQCMQVFTVTGSEVFTSSIWPRTCVLHKFTIRGDYAACTPLSVVSVDLKFSSTGNPTVTVSATVNANGTWEFQGELGDLAGLGIQYGTWYDVVPCLNLSDGTSIIGEQFIPGQNNDIYFADQSDPQVVVNNSATDATTSLAFVCEGDPLYYHGVDPLSANHFSAIRRKPKNSPGPFTDYQAVEWVGSSLNGFTGDLNAQYPGYFQVGYIYQLYIASYNDDPNVCIAWSPVTVEFEVIDCCEPNAYFENVPDCVKEGKVFSVSVVIEAPLTADDIENIYSGTPDFTYVTHQVVAQDGTLVLTIWFETNSCTCEGEMLIMDIILKGCSEPIWMMTDKLPCCAEDCKIAEIGKTSVEDCIIVNGKPARKFCLQVSSTADINDVLVGTNDITCQTDIINLDVQSTGPGAYSICGIMVFEDPDCTGHALLTFILDTEFGCCKLEKAFSFPGGCTIPEPCLSVSPNIEIIYLSDINVSLDLPVGETVTVIDHTTGSTTTTTVGEVTCGPFAIDQNGNIFGGTPCAGIHLTAPKDLDCSRVEGQKPYVPYYFEIRWGDCVWVISGNYCNELIVLPQVPNDGGTKRSSETESLNPASSGELRIFPNPIAGTDIINFDVSYLDQTINNIRITDMQGRLIESFVPAAEQQAFQHHLRAPLAQGVYFIILELADGSLNSTKLIAVE